MQRRETVYYEENGQRFDVKAGREELIKYRDICKRQTVAKKEMDKAIKERGEMEPRILDIIEEIGQSNVKVGGATVYLHRQLWGNARQDHLGNRDYETATKALIMAGVPEMVQTRFNVMQVSAYIRELDKNDEIPIVLREGLQIDEKISARVRG